MHTQPRLLAACIPPLPACCACSALWLAALWALPVALWARARWAPPQQHQPPRRGSDGSGGSSTARGDLSGQLEMGVTTPGRTIGGASGSSRARAAQGGTGGNFWAMDSTGGSEAAKQQKHQDWGLVFPHRVGASLSSTMRCIGPQEHSWHTSMVRPVLVCRLVKFSPLCRMHPGFVLAEAWPRAVRLQCTAAPPVLWACVGGSSGSSVGHHSASVRGPACAKACWGAPPAQL